MLGTAARPHALLPCLLGIAGIVGLTGLGLAGCSKGSSSSEESEATAKTEAPAQDALAQAQAGPRLSRGFQKSKLKPVPRMDKAERLKLVKLLDDVDDKRKSQELPKELKGRRDPAATDRKLAMDVYLDGKLVASVSKKTLETSSQLYTVLAGVGAGVDVKTLRSVLVYGEDGNKWVTSKQLRQYKFRVNRRNKVKFEPEPGVTGEGKHARRPEETRPREDDLKKVGLTKKSIKEAGLRAVSWIEVRTTDSPRIAGEPN